MLRHLSARARTPHLPFEMDLSALPSDVHVTGLWHGTAHTLRLDGAVDPRLPAGQTDAAGTRFNITGYNFYNEKSDLPSGSAAGGMHQARIRVGPIPRSGTEWAARGWRALDVDIEMHWLRDAGWTFIAWEPLGTAGNNFNTFKFSYDSADATGFKVACQVDSATLKSQGTTAVAFADAIRSYITRSSGVSGLAGGIPLFCFDPDQLGVTWFADMFGHLESGSPAVNGAFLVPIFNDGSAVLFDASLSTYGPLMTRAAAARGTTQSWCGWWANTYPGSASSASFSYKDVAEKARGAGHKVLWCLRHNQVRRREPPKTDRWYNETDGLRLIYELGEYFCSAKQTGDILYINSWNDLSDGSDFCPGDRHQWVPYDLMSYWAAYYRSGRRPAIVRDCIYYAHRLHAWDALPNTTYQSVANGQTGNAFPNNTNSSFPSTNNITVLVFATEAATCDIVTSEGTTATEVPAGVTLCQAPLPFTSGGIPSFRLRRRGQTVIDFPSAFPVRAGKTAGTGAKYWQDHTYGMGGWLRYRLGQLGHAHPYIEPVELCRSWTKGMGRYG